jgi:hypothetical protein
MFECTGREIERRDFVDDAARERDRTNRGRCRAGVSARHVVLRPDHALARQRHADDAVLHVARHHGQFSRESVDAADPPGLAPIIFDPFGDDDRTRTDAHRLDESKVGKELDLDRGSVGRHRSVG